MFIVKLCRHGDMSVTALITYNAGYEVRDIVDISLNTHFFYDQDPVSVL